MNDKDSLSLIISLAIPFKMRSMLPKLSLPRRWWSTLVMQRASRRPSTREC